MVPPLPRTGAPVAEMIHTAPLAVPGLFGVVGGRRAVLTVVAVPVMIVGIDRVERLHHSGQAVVVELQSKSDTTLTVRYQPPTGPPLQLSTDGSEQRTIGRLYPRTSIVLTTSASTPIRTTGAFPSRS